MTIKALSSSVLCAPPFFSFFIFSTKNCFCGFFFSLKLFFWREAVGRRDRFFFFVSNPPLQHPHNNSENVATKKIYV